MKRPLCAPVAALLLTVCAACLMFTPRPPASSPVVPEDLRDALGRAMLSRDLAAAHAGLVEEGQDSCRLCHVRVRVSASRPLWADPSSWIASNSPAAAMPERNMRDSNICLSCHDGVATSENRTYKVVDPSHARVGTGIDLKKGHPIGVDYLEVMRRSPAEYLDPAANPNIRLDNGAVACVSCHSAHGDTDTVSRPASCTDCHRGK